MLNNAEHCKVVLSRNMSHLAENNLWRQVFRSSAERPRPSFDSLCKPEVGDLVNKIFKDESSVVDHFIIYFWDSNTNETIKELAMTVMV